MKVISFYLSITLIALLKRECPQGGFLSAVVDIKLLDMDIFLPFLPRVNSTTQSWTKYRSFRRMGQGGRCHCKFFQNDGKSFYKMEESSEEIKPSDEVKYLVIILLEISSFGELKC